jgi:hypothetical protein
MEFIVTMIEEILYLGIYVPTYLGNDPISTSKHLGT